MYRSATYPRFKGCIKSIFYYHFIQAFKWKIGNNLWIGNVVKFSWEIKYFYDNCWINFTKK